MQPLPLSAGLGMVAALLRHWKASMDKQQWLSLWLSITSPDLAAVENDGDPQQSTTSSDGTTVPQGSNWYRDILSGSVNAEAKEVYATMLEWADPDVWQGFTDLKEVSTRNILRLAKYFDPGDGFPAFTAEEHAFMDNLFDTPFYATHFTNADVVQDDKATLLSRKSLLDAGIIFNTENSTKDDIECLANDDCVFFAMEPGEFVKKPTSRFGDKLHSFNFSDPIFAENGWMSLNEMLKTKLDTAGKHLPWLSETEREDLQSREIGTVDHVFLGPHILMGLALTILDDCRTILTPENRDRVLAIRSADELNAIVNGFYRPELKLPKRFAPGYAGQETLVSKAFPGMERDVLQS
jgi:hypothetical protein